MSFIKRIGKRLRREMKFSISNPDSFKEIWSVNSNGIRVISLSIILLIVIVILISLLLSSGWFGGYLKVSDSSIERDRLEEQNQEIVQLADKIKFQEEYIENIKFILSGELKSTTPVDSIKVYKDSIQNQEFNTEMTDDEKLMANKVKDDMFTFSKDNDSKSVLFYSAPVKGVISQRFNKQDHPGVDIVAAKNTVVKACLAGTVIYAGFTHKDGHILIIEHSDGIVSIYKHNQRVMKKAGSKVQIGDPIAIIGNTGENSDGPHLHFELWKDQQVVDPEKHIDFTR